MADDKRDAEHAEQGENLIHLDEEGTARLLGLSRRAGMVQRGEELCLKSLRRGEGHLLILAGDTAPGSRQKILSAAREREVPVRAVSTKRRLGELLGWGETAYVLIKDESMARGILARSEEAQGPDGDAE